MSEDKSKDADAGAAVAEKTPAGSPVKKEKIKKKKKAYPPNHPPFSEMITEALNNLGEASIQAIKKHLVTEYGCELDSKMTWYVRNFLSKGVANGKIIQTTGKGASGCFKMGSLLQTVSKPTKRQLASAEAAAEMKAKAEADAKRLAKKPKSSRGRHIPKKAAKKKPAAKKSAVKEGDPNKGGRPPKKAGRPKGRK